MIDIDHFLATLETAYTEHPWSNDDRVRLLCGLRTLQAGIRAFATEVERDVMENAGEKSWVVPGLGTTEIKKKTGYSGWDNDGLTRRLVALALDERVLDIETGEYEPAWEAVARVLSECARPSWRVTPLRARGLQVDEFCRVESQGWSVKLPPA